MTSTIPEVARFATLDEGVRLGGAEPFLVPRAGRRELLGVDDPEIVLSTLRDSAHLLFGYDRSDAIVELPASAVFQAWHAGTLAINLLDAPLPALAELLLPETKALLETRTVSPVLTKAGAYTALHVDPPAHGGGWMFLSCGDKEWLFLDPSHIALVYDAELRELRDLPLDALLALVPEGSLRRCRLQGGDLLYFPPGWLHRVRTSSDSVGVGGYILREQDRPRAEELTRWLVTRGLVGQS